eukprot:TRINITY_DN11758_c2_g1_i1.p2 TRINITY_DN11758_c2_g1~~TRINITY_DN11758_c2_g1_i1.p2  ORF type:complete len:213 (+),score=12.01 TRINITY_DN11758_c2_g1_i1:410-1048(+)
MKRRDFLLLDFSSRPGHRRKKEAGTAARVEPDRPAFDGKPLALGRESRRRQRPTVRPEPLRLHVPVLPPRRQVEVAALERLLRGVRNYPDDLLHLLRPPNVDPRKDLQQPRVLLRRPRHLELRLEIQVDQVPLPLPAAGSDDVDKLVVPARQSADGLPLRLADSRIVAGIPQRSHHRPPESRSVRSQAGKRVRCLGNVREKVRLKPIIDCRG